jgi:soluble lytic murein transglycosylase-like protein
VRRIACSPGNAALQAVPAGKHALSLALVSPLIYLILSSLAVLPASAQVVSVLDEHGQRVYINVGPTPKPTAAVESANDAQGLSGKPSANNANHPAASAAAAAAPETQELAPLTNDRLERLVKTVSERHQVDPALVRAVMRTESGGNPTAVSSKGALGLMQLMPATARELGVSNVFNPLDNLEGGVRYLRTLLERYNGDLDKALAAYNAGAGAVDRAGGVPHYRETRDYVRKVRASYSADGSGSATADSTAHNANSTLVPAPHPMYRTVDEQGRVVWVNN